MSDQSSQNDTPEETSATSEAEAVKTDEPQPSPVEEATPTPSDPEALLAQIAELKDQLLRAVAETENVRRRAERERLDAAKYGAVNFARDMLGVADNLRRAIEALPDEARADAPDAARQLIEGVEVTERALLSAFERNGITVINPEPGTRFDPNLHEAMFEVPGTGQPNGSVVQVIEPGYLIGERLLRAARVGVAKDAGASPTGASVDTSA